MKVGIVGYGSYIPKFRIRVEEIAKVWKQDFEKIKKNLLIEEKSVSSQDQDCVTLATQAAQNALNRASLDRKKIGALYVGSESHPYAVKPTSTIVGTSLNLSNNYMAADLEFACKAGTAAIQICLGLVKSGLIEYGLAIASDTAQSTPGDILEYSAGSASAAFIIGRDEKEIVATIDATQSYTTDTPDFWRRGLEKYPQHAGKFTSEPAYFKHVLGVTELIMQKTGTTPKDFDYVIFHQPNGKFPTLAAKRLGFTTKQLEQSLLVTKIGNSYSASTPISLAHILDIAQKDQKILVTSYGSGSGSDSFILTTTAKLKDIQKKAPTTKFYVDQKEYLDYSIYRKNIETII